MSDTRRLIHDQKVTIRVDAEVKRRAIEAAQRQGMSLSEAMRQFLRELAAGAPPSEPPEVPERAREAQKYIYGADIRLPDRDTEKVKDDEAG